MSDVGWKALAQPVLARITAGFDAGVTLVDPVAHADTLGLTAHQVAQALRHLTEVGLIEAGRSGRGSGSSRGSAR